MTTLYISEFPDLAQGINRGGVDIVDMPPFAEQTVSTVGGPNASKPFNSSTKIIRVVSDSVCSIAISRGAPAVGAAGATTSNMRIAANANPEYFRVQPGSVLSVIANT
jgi:hypothetical protein